VQFNAAGSSGQATQPLRRLKYEQRSDFCRKPSGPGLCSRARSSRQLSYAETVSFTFNAVDIPFLLDLTFEILDNGKSIIAHSFRDLASAQSFFSDYLLDLTLEDGPQDIQLMFAQTMSEGQGVGSTTPQHIPFRRINYRVPEP
jgi:hypothetical protein